MIRHALFIVALLAQFGILAYAPLEKAALRRSGRTVVLRTVPVDPYDVMRGYFVTLRYEISRPPGLEESGAAGGDVVYAVLAKGDDGVWTAVRAAKERSRSLEEGRVVIRGRREGGHRAVVDYGIEKYFIPEAAREEIERAVRKGKQRILVDVALDDEGAACVLRLRVGGKVYEY